MGKNETQEAFEYAQSEIPGLKAISAVEIETGLAHGSLVVDKSFDLDAASAYNAEVVKAKIKAKNAMGMTKEKVELMIIELSHQIHMIQPTPNEKFVVYMAADRSANIGITRKAVLEVSKRIEASLN